MEMCKNLHRAATNGNKRFDESCTEFFTRQAPYPGRGTHQVLNLTDHVADNSHMGKRGLGSAERKQAEIVFCMLGRKFSPSARAIFQCLGYTITSCGWSEEFLACELGCNLACGASSTRRKKVRFDLPRYAALLRVVIDNDQRDMLLKAQRLSTWKL